MAEETTVRIGLASARELEIVVDEPDTVVSAFEKAVKGKDAVLWFTDVRGHRFGITVASVAFIEIDKPQQRGVGF
ncbi:MAG: DUF3107 family protein [Acidimicrobiia bacterium]